MENFKKRYSDFIDFKAEIVDRCRTIMIDRNRFLPEVYPEYANTLPKMVEFENDEIIFKNSVEQKECSYQMKFSIEEVCLSSEDWSKKLCAERKLFEFNKLKAELESECII